jgi:flagellar hook-associated protein 1 FlgK
MSSLFTSLGLAGSALKSAGTAVRTVGQNIANANTEGYTRQRVQMVARPADDLVHLQLGTGVDVARVERVMDQRLEEMLREARSGLGDLQTRDGVLGRIETMMGELDGDSVSTALSKFFDAAEDLVNQPEDQATRSVFLARASDLAGTFTTKDSGLLGLRNDLEAEVRTSVEDINRLTTEIADLNRQVVAAENGGQDPGSANDLRDQREALVKQLSDLVSVRAVETQSGSLNVLAGSDFLVLDDQARALTLDTKADGDSVVSQVRFQKDGNLLTVRGGKLNGLLITRDQTVPGMRKELDTLAKAVIGEVNRLHSQGQGLVGWQSATGTRSVADPNLSLSSAGLIPPAKNGSFDLKVVDSATGQTNTYNIVVDLDGLNGDDTTLNGLAGLINAAVSTDHPSLSASVTLDGRLAIASSDAGVKFSFGTDTSGVLAGLGVGTLFSGTGAADMGVNQALTDEPRLVATGQGGGTTDSSNIARIAALRDAKTLENGGASFEDFYQGMVGVLGVDRERAQNLLQNQQAMTDHLTNERSAISGVDLDEESIDLIRYQRAYQGAARFLSVIDSLMEALLSA